MSKPLSTAIVGLSTLLAPLPCASQWTSERGVSLEFGYTAETMSNVSGGVRRGTVFLDDIGLALTVDAERFFGWKGGTIHVSSLGNYGGSPSDLIGDLQTVSNIDAYDTWKIFEAYVDQSMFGGRLSVLVGLFDLNSEFDAIETAGLFLNSSHGIGPDYSQTGQNGPSIFPTTSMAFRARFLPTDALTLQVVVLDAVSGDPDNPAGTRVGWNSEEGFLVSGEVGFNFGGPEAVGPRLALGGYLYSEPFDSWLDVDEDGDPVARSGNGGLYILGETPIFTEPGDPGQGLSTFVRFGVANGSMNQLGSYLGAGLVYTGVFPGRDRDQLGIAVGSANNGADFRALQVQSGVPVDRSEVTLELTYNAPLSDRFFVQPDIQYVINPGTDPGLSNAFVLALRAGIAL